MNIEAHKKKSHPFSVLPPYTCFFNLLTLTLKCILHFLTRNHSIYLDDACILFSLIKIFPDVILQPKLLLLSVSHRSCVSLWDYHLYFFSTWCFLSFFMSLFLDMLLLKSRISDIPEAETYPLSAGSPFLGSNMVWSKGLIKLLLHLYFIICLVIIQ